MRFRDLWLNCEIDIIDDSRKIDQIRKDVGLSVDQTKEIVLQLINERKEKELEQEKNKFCFCPNCGYKLPD